MSNQPTSTLTSAGKTETTASQSESFASLFEASLVAGDFGKEGEIVKGTIVAVQRDNVVIDIGGKSEGIIALSEFADAQGQTTIKPGDEVDVYIESRENDDGLVTLSKEKADKMKVWDEISSACERDELIAGTISQRVKGGLSVTIRGDVKVIKFNKKRGNIVLSRRVLLEKERDQIKTQTLQTLEEGKVVKGVIKNITEYGAFVDLGGIDGLLHITDMSWGRVNHPSELFQVGDEVTVRVLKYNPETERVSLALKQTQEDRGSHAEEASPPGKKVRGKVQSITDYGAFVELEPGVEGLIHVSEMSWTKKVKHPSKVLEIGQEVECQVLEVDAKSKRISLGLKQLEPDPWTLFTEKYKPGDKIGGKVRSITDYGVFVGIEEGVDGMVHKSDISWTAKVNNPSDLYKKGDDVEAIILSINHDEKKVSLGVKQLWDDPWPTIFNEYPPGKLVQCKVLSIVDYGIFVQVRPGVEGLIAQGDIVSAKDEAGKDIPLHIGDSVEAEIANIDSQERRLTLSMRKGDAPPAHAPATTSAATSTTSDSKPPPAPRPSKIPKKAAAADSSGGTIGELIKQKLGAKLATISEKQDDDASDEKKTDE